MDKNNKFESAKTHFLVIIWGLHPLASHGELAFLPPHGRLGFDFLFLHLRIPLQCQGPTEDLAAVAEVLAFARFCFSPIWLLEGRGKSRHG